MFNNLKKASSHDEIQFYNEQLKDNVSILNVAERLGILEKYNITKHGSNAYLGDCPTGHPSENHQCFGIHTEGNYYHCFHCNAAGDIISLVEHVKSIGFKEAIIWLAKEFLPEYAAEIERLAFSGNSEDDTKEYQQHILFNEIYMYGKQILFEETGKDALAALEKRSYMEELIKETDWIYWPNQQEIRKHLLQQFPGMHEMIAGLKLNGAFGDNFRLAFPYKNRHGIITGFVKRSTERSGVKGIRYDSTPGVSKKDLFGLNRLQGQDAIIVEGYPDALYFPVLGMQNVLALGQGILSKDHLDGLKSKKVRRITLALDNDAAGIENTERAIELLAEETDIEVYVVDPQLYGQYKDPDELVAASGIDAFNDLIQNRSVSSARWIAERILGKYDLKRDHGRKDILADAFTYARLLNNPVDTQCIMDLVASGLELPVYMLEPHFQKYQEDLAKEEYAQSTRKLINKAGALLHTGDVEGVQELLSMQPRELAMAYEQNKIGPQESFGSFLRLKKQQDMQRVPDQLLGYKLTRFASIAEHMSGIQPGNYILGADPNVGKTAFLVNLAMDLLYTNPEVSVYFYSMDDDRKTIVNRMLAMLTGLEINTVQRMQSDPANMKILDDAYNYLSSLYERGRLMIKDITEMNNFDDLELEIRRIKGKEHLVVFIDGLYNMNVSGDSKSVREENIKRAMRMKELTKTYNIPLIATAELRKRDQTQDKNKQRSGHDIMETGKYQYNADVIWMLAPEDYDAYDTSDEPTLVLKFDKNKLESFRGSIELKFIRAKSTFEEAQGTKAQFIGFSQRMMQGTKGNVAA